MIVRMNRFINDRKDNWQRLEDLLGLLGGSSLKGLSRVEVREFGELYRRAAADLAIARAETRDPKVINYLNGLVIRAHGKIYRAEGEGASLIANFFLVDLPRAFRSTFRYSALAFAVFTAAAIAGFVLCYADLAFADVIDLNMVRSAAESGERWWMQINQANPIASSGIMTNNIRVAFLAFALGAFFGVGTIYVLVMNGFSIGGALGICYKVDPAFANDLATFMAAHGVIELSCIFIAGGAGMRIGYSIIDPGDLTRSQALKNAGMEAARIVIGCACFLVIAGIIEGFISPSDLPAAAKIATGILTGVVMFAYLSLTGREDASADSAAGDRLLVSTPRLQRGDL
jgi:uncharacterized membrane protein SpoIIM required for sporulation